MTYFCMSFTVNYMFTGIGVPSTRIHPWHASYLSKVMQRLSEADLPRLPPHCPRTAPRTRGLANTGRTAMPTTAAT